MTKPTLYVIQTDTHEFHVTAMDWRDAVETSGVDVRDILAIEEHPTPTDRTLH